MEQASDCDIADVSCQLQPDAYRPTTVVQFQWGTAVSHWKNLRCLRKHYNIHSGVLYHRYATKDLWVPMVPLCPFAAFLL